MGCSTSVLRKRGAPPLRRSIENSIEDKPTFLTTDQQDAIRETWRLIHAKGALNVSNRIFLFIFQLKPEVKSYFPFRGVWGDKLFAHPQFRDHVTRFVSTIDAVVENVNDIENEVIMTVKKTIIQTTTTTIITIATIMMSTMMTVVIPITITITIATTIALTLTTMLMTMIKK